MSPITTVVIPTVGRPSLFTLLEQLEEQLPDEVPVMVVDDRQQVRSPLLPDSDRITVVETGGAGPARARNLGWRHARTEWVSFLDDDVLLTPEWWQQLHSDLQHAPPEQAGSQGHVEVPLPPNRRPTDWERVTHGLSAALWITADMSYRRCALARVGGFDERFRSAFREDADLAWRVSSAGGALSSGQRRVLHPVRPASRWVSVRKQAGNADDMLMRWLHGPDWHNLVGAPRGRRRRHLLTTGAILAAAAAALSGRRKLAWSAATLWAALSLELTLARILPGPASVREWSTMIATSMMIPPVATWHTLRGWVRHRNARPWRGLPDLVLFDRDDTLITDVPYNGDPTQVTPVPGASAALETLRSCGIRTGVITNQSGVARGLLDEQQVEAVNLRVEELLGPFDVWQYCPHGTRSTCQCRKPAPGMVLHACQQLGTPVSQCVVIGDIGSDVAAGITAGARAILIPTPHTRTAEILQAPAVAASLAHATERIVKGQW